MDPKPQLPSMHPVAPDAESGSLSDAVTGAIDGVVVHGSDKRRRKETEHLATLKRVRVMVAAAAVMLGAFGGVDWLVAEVFPNVRFSHLILVRFVSILALGLFMLRLGTDPPPGPGMLRLLERATTSLGAIVCALMSIEFGGLTSPSIAGLSVLLIARGVILSDPWRVGAVSLGLPFLVQTIVLLGSSLWNPSIAAQLHSPPALVTYSMFLSNNFAVCIVCVVGGHIVWTLRRQLQQARSIGRYELKTKLGEGGMGEVWIAYHPVLKRNLALKILQPRGEDRARAVARFEREVRATTELTHPNTVRVFDYGATEDGLWYYAMELLEGDDLGHLVEREGPLPPARALHLMQQAARALAEAHARGIVHRDIKPENLFLTSLGGEHDFVKVLDFGIAKFREAGSATITQAGTVLGSPLYMAPETLRGSSDARADIYALGAVLYFLLTARPPFMAVSAPLVMLAHMNETPKRPSSVTKQVIPADLEAITLRCLAKDPADRFPSAAELVAAFGDCKDAGRWVPSAPTSLRSKVAREAADTEVVAEDPAFAETARREA
jgi:serine/threonine-protein kinase